MQYINIIEQIRLPSYLKGALISVEIGSDTRIFVSKVVDWAKKNMKSELFDNDIFKSINDIGKNIINVIKRSNFYKCG